MGRSRGHQQLVAGRAAYPGGAPAQEICGKERVAARGARRPRVPRIHAAAAGRRRARPRLSENLLRSAARHLHAGHAQLSRTERRGPGGEVRAGRVFSRAAAGRLAQARAGELAGGLEGDRRRHADRADRCLRRRPQMGVEAVAQGDGPARGRELEIADLLSFIKRAGVRNTVWLTADVHYTAAHYYDPGKAVFQDFEPFWEFVSGPLHAGTFGPNQLDNTFGPQLMYIKAPTKEQ